MATLISRETGSSPNRMLSCSSDGKLDDRESPVTLRRILCNSSTPSAIKERKKKGQCELVPGWATHAGCTMLDAGATWRQLSHHCHRCVEIYEKYPTGYASPLASVLSVVSLFTGEREGLHVNVNAQCTRLVQQDGGCPYHRFRRAVPTHGHEY